MLICGGFEVKVIQELPNKLVLIETNKPLGKGYKVYLIEVIGEKFPIYLQAGKQYIVRSEDVGELTPAKSRIRLNTEKLFPVGCQIKRANHPNEAGSYTVYDYLDDTKLLCKSTNIIRPGIVVDRRDAIRIDFTCKEAKEEKAEEVIKFAGLTLAELKGWARACSLAMSLQGGTLHQVNTSINAGNYVDLLERLRTNMSCVTIPCNMSELSADTDIKVSIKMSEDFGLESTAAFERMCKKFPLHSKVTSFGGSSKFEVTGYEQDRVVVRSLNTNDGRGDRRRYAYKPIDLTVIQ